EHLDLKEKTSYAINLIAIPGRELKLFITHDPAVYGAAVVGRMLEHMKNALAAMADPATRNVGDIALMGAAERARVLNNRDAAVQPTPAADPVYRFLERRAAAAPNDIALVVGAEHVTYQQLNRRANQLADHLTAAGARPGTVVGVCLDLSAALLEALFGILKTGATCLLLDPRDPPGRRDYAMKDAGASLLVTHSALSAATPPDLVRVDIDSAREAIARRSEQDPAPTPVEDEPALICYVSSGRTGPVGVQLSHRAIVSALSGVASATALAPTDMHLVPSVQVVARSVCAMLLPMMAGGRLVLLPPERTVDDSAWVALLASSAATVLSATPQRLRRMLTAGWVPKAGMKILCAGEPLPRELARELLERGADVHTLYGTEETGAWSACHRLAAADEYRSIGRALPHAAIYVLDRRLHPVPAGVVGEIYVGGVGLADGYLNQPRLTDAHFPTAFPADVRGPLFRTGDLGSYRDDGTVDFAGRHDSRVVIDGVRIEPEEMITRMTEHEAVEHAAVLVHEQPSGEPRLTAYYSRRPEREVSITDIRKHMRRHVRSDTVLLDVVELERFPLAAGGVIDYAALRAAVAPGNGNGAERAAPGTDSEQKIAAIWKATLGIERVGTNDNFFELGGNSLLAMQVIAGIEAATGTRISARALLMNTLQQIAALCAAPAPTTPAAGARNWRDRIRSVLPIPGRSSD
ncbi:MAG: AMP-binding protein, partial [Gammaproteobacteria bacterium]